jgi:radical SAM superfamily enzyme YgiQ (UPF0313 family)
MRHSYRRKDISAVLDAIEKNIETTGIRIFEFAGLAYSPSELKTFSSGVLERGLDIRWGCRPRIEHGLSPEILDLMVESGVYVFHLAVETFNERLQSVLGKGYDIPTAKACIDHIMRRHPGIPLVLNIMYDIPTETVDELQQTLNYLRTNGLSGEIFRFWLDRSSEMYARASELGIIPVERCRGSRTKTDWRHISPELEAMRPVKERLITDLRAEGVISGSRNYFSFSRSPMFSTTAPSKLTYFMAS